MYRLKGLQDSNKPSTVLRKTFQKNQVSREGPTALRAIKL